MKCYHCGLDNPEGRKKCDRCGKPLVAYSSNEKKDNMESEIHDRATELHSSKPGFNPRATVRESSSSASSQVAVCSTCGYELDSDGNCPNCGSSSSTMAPQKSKEQEPFNARATQRPQRKNPKEGCFTLVPISEENGQPEGDALQYEGNEVYLNRSNTDSKNSTITSKTQAVINCEDGHWKIVDKSELSTTFVQAADAVELKPGSLILMGNQLYRFETK